MTQVLDIVRPIEARRWKFTVNDVDLMYENGIIPLDERVELIHGELISMNAIGSNHFWCVANLDRLLQKMAGDEHRVIVQMPMNLNEGSRPEPDIMIICRDVEDEERLPTPSDVLLLIEVSDTTLIYDRHVKSVLYAEAGIPEMWIIDLNGKSMEILSGPSAKGYKVSKKVRRTTKVTPKLVPGISLYLSDVLK